MMILTTNQKEFFVNNKKQRVKVKPWKKVKFAMMFLIIVAILSVMLYIKKYTRIKNVREFRAGVLLWRADNAFFDKKYDLSIARYNAVAERYMNDTDPRLRFLAAYALYQKADRFWRLGNSEKQIKAYDECVEHFHNETNPEARGLVASAFTLKANTLLTLAKTNEAFMVFDECITRFQNDPDHEVSKNIFYTFKRKAETLARLGKTEEAITTYNECLEKYKDEKGNSSRYYYMENERDAFLKKE